MKFPPEAETRVHGVRVRVSANKRILVAQDYFPVISVVSCILEPIDSLMGYVNVRAHSARGNTYS